MIVRDFTDKLIIKSPVRRSESCSDCALAQTNDFRGWNCTRGHWDSPGPDLSDRAVLLNMGCAGFVSRVLSA